MFLSIGMLKQKYFLADIFILSAEKQPIKLSWRKIEWLQKKLEKEITIYNINLMEIILVFYNNLYELPHKDSCNNSDI